MPTAATPTADLRDEQVTAAVDRFLRNASHTVRREIEKAVRNAIASGTLKATDSLPAAITLSSDKVGLAVTIHGRIEL